MQTRTERHTFVLAGNGSYANRGCEAIVRGTAALLRDRFGECRLISNYFAEKGCLDAQQETDPAIVHRPFPLLKRYSLPWIEEQIARKVFHQPYNVVRASKVFRRSTQQAKAALMIGGDNYSFDYYNVDLHFRFLRIAAKNKVPVIIWGASIGPFTSRPEYERWAAQELRQVSLICVRETATQEYLASIGVKENVILAADPAFCLEPEVCTLPANVEKALADGCTGVNLSPLLQQFVKTSDSRGERLSTWIQIATEVIRTFVRHCSLPLLLIPHVTLESTDLERDDHLFLRHVAEQAELPERVFVLTPNLNAAQTKWVIGRLHTFAGARTHSTLAAISSGVPTICIGYSMKARGISQDVYGHQEWLVKGQDLVQDPAILSERLVSLGAQASEIRSHLAQVKPLFVRRAQRAVAQLADVVGLE